MSSDVRTAPDGIVASPAHAGPLDLGVPPSAAAAARRAVGAPPSEDSQLAVDVRSLVERGAMDEARERFGELVALHQRRASRIAYQYLRDSAEADEAVQDAFVKVFSHIESYREAWPFEAWFTRILINGCLDRRKARLRRARWFVATDVARLAENARPAFGGAAALDPEARLLARERRARLAAAVDRLDGRPPTIFMLSHYGDCTPPDAG